MKNKPFIVAIVGRPNVGKSSLFNAILKRRLAIVHQEPGVTRDRVAAPMTWRGRRFQLLDTGGLGFFSGEKKGVGAWDMVIRQQVDLAVLEADLIIFLTDVLDGMTPLDGEIAAKIRSTNKTCLLAVNKADNENLISNADEFSTLGFDSFLTVSATHRRGISELMDNVIAHIPSDQNDETAEKSLRIAVLGRPNVGKSTLVNQLLGEERVVVSDIPGTTRDAVDVDLELVFGDEREKVTLIDTAGLRKKSKIDNAVERYSVMRAQEALKRADLALFVLEATMDGVTAQDRKVAEMLAASGKGVLLLANKWDQCTGLKQKHVEEEIRYSMPFMNFAPLIFISAINGHHINRALSKIFEIKNNMTLKIPTSMINRLISDAMEKHSPPMYGRKPLKIYYATMTKSLPPSFVLFVNDPAYCAKNYLGYLNNYLRKSFNCQGWPIRLHMKKRPRNA